MTLEDPQGVAVRLKLSPEAVSSLERSGLLRRLDLDDAEIRERLWRGHLAFVSASSHRAGDERPSNSQLPR